MSVSDREVPRCSPLNKVQIIDRRENRERGAGLDFGNAKEEGMKMLINVFIRG